MSEQSPEPVYLYEGGPKAGGNLVIKLGYRGEAFSGFAEQPTQRTVAGELRRALETMLRRPCELTCAGRTDAGVHAIAQYVSVPVSEEELCLPGTRLMRSLVALTPDDLSVSALYRASESFSARFDAQSRSYRYRICAGDARPVLAWDHAWWFKGSLDVDAMNEGAQLLLGEHDFKSFCKAHVPLRGRARRQGPRGGGREPRGHRHHGQRLPSQHGPHHCREPGGGRPRSQAPGVDV